MRGAHPAQAGDDQAQADQKTGDIESAKQFQRSCARQVPLGQPHLSRCSIFLLLKRWLNILLGLVRQKRQSPIL